MGRAATNLEAALERPEKRRRDQPVDTSQPGVSATDRRAGGGSTARRNAKKNAAGASYALEDSATGKPSRKSTRRSHEGQKPDSNLRRRQTRKVSAPKERASRAKVKGS